MPGVIQVRPNPSLMERTFGPAFMQNMILRNMQERSLMEREQRLTKRQDEQYVRQAYTQGLIRPAQANEQAQITVGKQGWVFTKTKPTITPFGSSGHQLVEFKTGDGRTLKQQVLSPPKTPTPKYIDLPPGPGFQGGRYDYSTGKVGNRLGGIPKTTPKDPTPVIQTFTEPGTGKKVRARVGSERYKQFKNDKRFTEGDIPSPSGELTDSSALHTINGTFEGQIQTETRKKATRTYLKLRKEGVAKREALDQALAVSGMPLASENKDKTIRDTLSGNLFKSDGVSWNRVAK